MLAGSEATGSSTFEALQAIPPKLKNDFNSRRTSQQVQSQLASQLSAPNGVIEFQKKLYDEKEEKYTRRILDLEKEKEKALLATIPTVITPDSSPEPGQSTKIRVDVTEGETPLITTTPTASSKISERLPDPEKFDGNRKDLRRFTQQIYSKLAANSDRFTSANSRLAYVASRLSGFAYELILPKVKFGIYQFVDYPQMLEYLEKAFGDPDRIKNAQNDLFRLRQKNLDFSAFFAEFERLALEGEMPDSALTPLLNQTISRELPEMLLHNSNPLDEFRTFARHLPELENRRRQYYQNTYTGRSETTIRSFQPKTTPIPQSSRPSLRQTTYASVTREQTSRDPMDLSIQRYASRPDKETGNCYRCHRPGHRSRDCLLPDTRPLEV